MRHLTYTILSAAAFAGSFPALAQEASLNPTFGVIDLRAGFPTDPNWVYVLAGGAVEGEFQDAASGEFCAGYFTEAPDFRLNYQTGSGLPLSITSLSDDDTVLLVNGPDGAWYCNDDTYGLNSAVTFAAPVDGVYDIWVGTYSDPEGNYLSAELGFTELEPFDAQIRRSFFGADDRVVVDPTVAPWSMIGLVEFTEGFCTGTLIAPDIVLTGAHCIVYEAGDEDTPPVAFRAGYQNETEVARAGVTSYHVPSAWRETEQEGTDFAFVFLDQPLGDQLGWMELGPLSPAEIAAYAAGAGPDILQAGYSADQPDVLTGNLDCPFIELGADNTLIHQCDTVQGDSGSPLFVQDGNGYRIIGVESYTDERPEMEFDLNIAMYVADVIAELQSLSTSPAPAAPADPLK
ncbi:trypsin-like serine peptidase [Nioella aestuarii]|uniref:trypsin-like serine peptidase n=1 Tax=Nioella aestuarii TaxID=1662864 RepID=UPI003D7F9DEA